MTETADTTSGAVRREGGALSREDEDVRLDAAAAGLLCATPATSCGASADPIFAAIEASRRAQCEMDRWDKGFKFRPLSEAEFAEERRLNTAQFSAYEDVIATVPTTASGRLALLEYLRWQMGLYGMADGEPPDAGSAFWPDAYKALKAALGWDALGEDFELIALGRAFDAATVRDREANDMLTAAEDRAEPLMPPRPAALFYRDEDAPFSLRKHGDAFAGAPVSSGDIEWMKRLPAEHQVWVDDPNARPGWSMMIGKKPQIVPWPEAQARINEIVAAWDAWQAEQDHVLDAAGVTEARNDTAGTSDAAAALARQIAAQPARTVEGMQAKLRVAAFYCVCDPDTPEGEGYPGEAAIRSLYRDTPGIEISTSPSDIRIVPRATADADANDGGTVSVQAAHGADAGLIVLGQQYDTLRAAWQRADEAEQEPAGRRDEALNEARARGGPTNEDIRAAWRLPGVSEACERTENAYAALEPVVRKIAAAPAVSAQGLAVKARTLISAIWPRGNYEQDATLGESEDWGEQVARNLIEACCAAAGVDWRGEPVGPVPASAGSPLASLLRDLEKCDRQRDALTEADDETPKDKALYQQHWDLLGRIDALPALSAADLRTKARAAEISLKWDDRAECIGSGSFVSLAKQIVKALGKSPAVEVERTPSMAEQILDGWREWSLITDPRDEDDDHDALDRLNERRNALLDAADKLPPTLEHLHAKALAAAWLEYVAHWENGKARDAYDIDGRLALDIDTAICGRLATGA